MVRSGVILAILVLLAAVSPSRAADEPVTAPRFEEKRFEIPSRNYGSDVPLVALVPSGDAPATGWPLVILLHGLGGDERDWKILGQADRTLTGLRERKSIRAGIVVMPGMGSHWYVDAAEPGGIKAESAFMDDVMPFLRRTFAISRNADDVTIIGNSMGGYGALRFALKYPDTFGRVAALSPAIWQNVPADELDLPPDRINLLIESTYFHTARDRSVTEGLALPNPGPHFNRAFGDPFNARRFNELNPFTLLETRLADGAKLPRIFLSVGADDSHLLWRGAIAFFETMKAGNRPITFRVTEGDHTWDVWRTAFPEALTFVLAP